MTIAIEFKNVTRSFGTGTDRTLAVDGLSFSVPKGSVFGLLGANGAGKTTSIPWCGLYCYNNQEIEL